MDGITWRKAEEIFRTALSDSKNITLVTNPLRGHNGLVAEKFTENFGGKHIIFDPLNHGLLHDTVKSVFSVNSLPYFDIGNAKTIMSFGADWLLSLIHI